MKIGIVGQGYVGTAIKVGFEPHYTVETYDKYDGFKSTVQLFDLVAECEVIFVCVPTPMNTDGTCHTDIVESVIEEIDKWVSSYHKDIKPTVVIKSTVPPGTTDRLHKKYKNVDVIFNPEFLTEANFIEDFKNQDRIIIGGKRPYTTKVRHMYSIAFPKAHIIKTSSTIAEMVKYMTNSFLATKVSFANEIKMICDKLNVDYDKVQEYTTLDERLGTSHWSVPGPDGHNGFGGSCFPKDLNALIHLCRELNIPATTLFGAWTTNLRVRPEQDWKELKGRAVVDEDSHSR